MTVLRIVANLPAADPRVARSFYEHLLGLDVVMNHDWILTFAADTRMTTQVSFASEGGNGTEVPRLSIEVDDVDDVYGRATESGYEIVYPLTDEPWGVRRFFVRDPLGNAINILAHQDGDRERA
jgi:predicted enzyme related to lactoylglutathione lyase